MLFLALERKTVGCKAVGRKTVGCETVRRKAVGRKTVGCRAVGPVEFLDGRVESLLLLPLDLLSCFAEDYF